jgi:hypothetical protein
MCFQSWADGMTEERAEKPITYPCLISRKHGIYISQFYGGLHTGPLNLVGKRLKIGTAGRY